MSGWGIRANGHKLNRSKRQKLTKFGMGKLQNCDIPLNEEELGEMSIERQRATLELMSLLQKDPTKEGAEEKAKVTIATSPNPPPPKAPCEEQEFAADPASRSKKFLGGDAKWGIPKERIPKKRIPKKRIPKEKAPKEKIANERMEKGRASQRAKRKR